MKKEIIEYYFGDFVTSLGKPSLLLVGIEENNEMSCEKYIIFEELNETYSHLGENVTSPKIDGLTDSLQEFMQNQGLEHSRSIISLEAYKEAEKQNSNAFHFGFREINLRPTNQTAFLMHMNRKDTSQLNWIEKNTKSDKLKGLIRLHQTIKLNTKVYKK
jgi:hypothetical protein